MEGWGAHCVTLDLTAWAGQSDVKIAFETYSDLGNPLFIDNVAVSQFLDVEPIKEIALKVYPNPTGGSLNVVLDGGIKYTEVQVLNQFGQVLYQTKVTDQSNTVVIPDLRLNSGMYFVVARGENEVSTVKVLSF
jgi:hypothetical protein